MITQTIYYLKELIARLGLKLFYNFIVLLIDPWSDLYHDSLKEMVELERELASTQTKLKQQNHQHKEEIKILSRANLKHQNKNNKLT